MPIKLYSMTTVYQALSTTNPKDIITEYDKYWPSRLGQLTVEWIDNFKLLGSTSVELKSAESKLEVDEKKNEKWEIYVNGEEIIENSDPVRKLLRTCCRDVCCLDVSCRDGPGDGICYGFSYTPWNEILTHTICATDLEHYGSPLILAAIIDDITFHGWEEEKTKVAVDEILERSTELKKMMDESKMLKNDDGSVTFIPLSSLIEQKNE